MKNIEFILDDLNPEQKAAITCFDKPLRIIAGAGSGKTKVLTHKIAYLIESKKIKPNKIMALTFTNKAAKEMLSRVENLIGEKTEKPWILTFHSFCARFLRQEIQNYKNYQNDFFIIDTIDQQDILKRIYKEIEITQDEIPLFSMIEYISKFKNDLLEKENVESNRINELKKEILRKYQTNLEISNSLDFDDLQIITKEILQSNPNVLKKWMKKFEFILVDEFQDTSKIQYEIILLINDKKHITIVGDPDQTIYSWRGAEIEFINNFDRDFPDCLTITLNQNYRSTKKIIEAANNLISNNKNRIKKNLKTNNENGAVLLFHHASTPEMEALWVISKINELRKNKIQLKDIAILYRSNYYSKQFEDALIGESLSYKIFNGKRFYERAEIKDAISFLKSIWKPNDISLKRIINVPARKIGETTMNKLNEFALSKNLDLWNSWLKYFNEIKISQESKINLFKLIESLRKYNSYLKNKISISEVLKDFLNEINYMKMLEEDNSIQNNRKENVEELIKSIKHWESINPDKTIDDYLEEISLLTSLNEEDVINSITMMTIHAAKGLEFKNVFLVGMNESDFPSSKAIANDENNENLEEERRLAYVAITRAKEKLFLSCSQGFNFDTKQPKIPSRFLEEMGIKINHSLEEKSAKKILEQNIKKENDEIVVGDLVSHITFGEGVVLDINGDTIIIEFKNKKVGIKQLLKNHKSIERL